jgi:hypothetical protein
MSTTAQLLRRRAGAWVGRAFRMGLGVIAVGGALGLVAVRVSYARAADVGLNFGEELRSLGEGRLSGEVANDEKYELSLNGQPFDTITRSTTRPMGEVLQYFQDECTNDATGLSDKFNNLGETLDGLPRASGIPGYVIVRKDADERSFVFCLAPDHELDAKEKILRLRSVADFGDLGRLGDIRYVSVVSEPGGSTATAVWTHGSFNVNAMFPKVGDAPGEDLAGIPRPDGARRVLTGHIVGAPFGVNVYEASGTPTATLGALDAKLVGGGWKRVEMPEEIHAKARFYSFGNGMDIVVAARHGHAGVTDVSYMVSRAIGTVTR